VIVKKIGSRSFQISYTNPLTGTTQLLQRDAGMIILKKEWLSPSLAPSENRLTPKKHQEGMELQVGEMVIMMDYPDGTSQREGELLVELKDSHQRDESAAAHQECHLGKGWMPEQDHQGDGSNLEVPSSCWSGRS
jgi:hypothetical protein